jgi:hypothetical protein
MNSEDKLDQLFQAARQAGPEAADRGDLGFETRLLARLREERAERAQTAYVLWRLAPFFAGALAILTLVTAMTSHSPGLLDLATEPDALVLFLTAQ